ncbi:hydrolase [Lactobacillus sp. CC-MHH1034]|uniref:hydrolase n=1 Tax=Agrilactobacillus fermenti TaxID=2586909 RepID=UPI001E305A96|nr:hydrolase [Agrilactobacillus fermenti]MCD2255138.1 hydrolase [Agrilactobacillus fermenti]
MPQQYVPEIMTELREGIVKMPTVIKRASGIKIFEKEIHSVIFTTDIAIIKNTNADAVIAVYPFTPHPTIMQAITMAADIPVLSGIGGGTTQGSRAEMMAMFAEAQGSLGVVVNAPTPIATIRAIDEVVDIPIIATVVHEDTNIQALIDAGVSILNVSGAKKTAAIVAKIRKKFQKIPIIATGGKDDNQILETIESGANAITYTPPTNGTLFAEKMAKYRDAEQKKHEG